MPMPGNAVVRRSSAALATTGPSTPDRARALLAAWMPPGRADAAAAALHGPEHVRLALAAARLRRDLDARPAALGVVLHERCAVPVRDVAALLAVPIADVHAWLDDRAVLDPPGTARAPLRQITGRARARARLRRLTT